MAEGDVTMGGTGFLETVQTGIDSLFGDQPGDRTKTSTPVPQVVSDIIRPERPGTSGTYSSKREEGMRQASTLAMGGMKPPTPSNSRFAVLIDSSPAKAHALSSSHTFSPVPKMQRKSATAASSREQRVKAERSTTAAAGFSPTMDDDEEMTTARQQQRGRPKGWKPGMTYAEMRGEQPGRPRSSEAVATRRRAAPSGGGGGGDAKRRGRPPRALDANAREHYLQQNPTYTQFRCEWVQPAEQPGSGQERKKERPCPAELQNLETLRRHIYYAHEGDYYANDDSFVCRWGKCGEKKTDFADQGAFDAHVEWEHLRPFAWHVGDGVQNAGVEVQRQRQQKASTAPAQAQGEDPDEPPLPAYLFKDGVQVTPSIRDQRLEDDQRRRERRRKLRQLMIQKDENAPDEEEYVLQTLGLAQAQAK